MSVETCDIVDVVIDDSNAPADKTPSCTREQLLRAPDWRYQAAISYLQEEKAGRTAVIPTDIVVQFAIRVLRAYKNPENRLYVQQTEEGALYERHVPRLRYGQNHAPYRRDEYDDPRRG